MKSLSNLIEETKDKIYDFFKEHNEEVDVIFNKRNHYYNESFEIYIILNNHRKIVIYDDSDNKRYFYADVADLKELEAIKKTMELQERLNETYIKTVYGERWYRRYKGIGEYSRHRIFYQNEDGFFFGLCSHFDNKVEFAEKVQVYQLKTLGDCDTLGEIIKCTMIEEVDDVKYYVAGNRG